MPVGGGPGASVCLGDRLFIPRLSQTLLGSFLPQVWASQGRLDNPIWGSEALDLRLEPLIAGRELFIKAQQAQPFPLLKSPSQHSQVVFWPVLKHLG